MLTSVDSPTASTRHLYFAAHARYCVTRKGGVLLDLARNRYYGLTVEQAQQLTHWLSDAPPSGEPPTWLNDLRKRNLVVDDAPRHALPLLRIDVRRELEALGEGQRARVPLRATTIVRFLVACVWARYALSHRSLFDIAHHVASWHADAKLRTLCVNLHDAVCHFRRLRPFLFASREQCLFHALALAHFLHQQGHHPHWVIGVNPSPWGAHSWLQTEHAILDGTPEQVRLFTPIFAI
jgi:hypothetical protein